MKQILKKEEEEEEEEDDCSVPATGKKKKVQNWRYPRSSANAEYDEEEEEEKRSLKLAEHTTPTPPRRPHLPKNCGRSQHQQQRPQGQQ
jgi:hypothetical protein